jgi:mannose-6-phosphate isomerase-like protein (cupin superfamily)
MTERDSPLAARAALAAVPFEVERTKQRLEAAGGGYEIVHASPGLELGVYALAAPEPDRQQPHDDDEVYVVLDGQGVLDVEGRTVPLQRGQAVFVPAGAQHLFTAYEQMTVLVIFARRWRIDTGRAIDRRPA